MAALERGREKEKEGERGRERERVHAIGTIFGRWACVSVKYGQSNTEGLNDL